jgi:SAM-dependent methyltransferase
MRLPRLRRHWNELGRQDPLWAILTSPDKKGNQWSVGEFLETGRADVAALMQYLDALPVTVRRGRALDFGCGAGRLTRALADYFEEAVGVDIAPSMIELARRLHADSGRCRFLLNQTAALPSVPSGSVDLVYSRLVLQHIHPRYVRAYLKELVRVLAPGGALVFQLQSDAIAPVAGPGLKNALPLPVIAALRRIRDLATFPRMELHGLARDEVVRLLAALGVTIVDIVEDRSHGADTPGFQYCATKSV